MSPADPYGFTNFDDQTQQESAVGKDYGFQLFDEAGEPEQKKKGSSFVQGFASSPITQGALGALKSVTYPADFLKLAMLGEAFSDLDELEEIHKREGKEFDRAKYMQQVLKTSEAFPTQDLAEELVKEHTGLDLSPQDMLSKIVRRGAEIYSLQPQSLVKSTAGQISKKVAASGIGSGSTEGLKELGVPEPIAEIAGFGIGSGLATGKFVEKTLSKEGQGAKQIAETHGLRRVRGVEEGTAGRNPIISAKKQEKITKELSETSQKAIEDVIEQRLPLKTQRKSGVDLEDAYTSAYDRADQTAKSLDAAIASGSRKPVDYKNTLGFIKDKIQEIKNKAPSLSDSDKVMLKILRKERGQLTNLPKEIKPIYGPSGEIISETPRRTPKTSNASQAIQQKRNFNENVKGIWKKPEFSGSESKVTQLYAEMNEALSNDIARADQMLSSEVKFADKIFSQTQKINQVENILKPVFEKGYDASKLSRIMNSKSGGAFLERNLGKEAVQDLKDIATYGERAQRMVLSRVKNPKTLMDQIGSMPALKMGLLYLSHSHLPGSTTAVEISKAALPRIQGALLTRRTTSKAYKNFLKGAASPDSAAFKKASEELSKAIEEEFGTEDDLIDFSKEQKGD